MDTKQWKKQWNTWIRATKLPGVWQRKEGGYLVRSRVTESTTGHQREIRKVLQAATEAQAYSWLEAEKARVKNGGASVEHQKIRFAEYAQQLFERKIATREIRSAVGRMKWAKVLEHLIAGTRGKKSKKTANGFGEMYVDKIQAAHIEAWKHSVGELILADDYAPTTCNGWLAILRVVMKAAKHELGLRNLATEGVRDFDESEHATYTEEEPNSLLVQEATLFMQELRELHPQHFAMAYLGLVTGLRPSSLRPLRRKGPLADVLWDEGKLFVRRSHTRGDEVMRTTKQKKRYQINLPDAVLDVLRWHVETQLTTAEMQESDLLFPATTGGFRSPSVLNKPFAEVAEAIGLGKRFSQCGLRRTFNDLARAAKIEDVVTRSISGHLTERMQVHYSTVNADEQRTGIARVISLVDALGERAAVSGMQGGMQTPSGGMQSPAEKEKAS